LLANGFSNHEAPSFPLQNLKRKTKFEAHQHKVDKVLMIKENSVLLSTGGDKRLKLWSFLG
jgi:hypothetical protein